MAGCCGKDGEGEEISMLEKQGMVAFSMISILSTTFSKGDTPIRVGNRKTRLLKVGLFKTRLRQFLNAHQQNISCMMVIVIFRQTLIFDEL